MPCLGRKRSRQLTALYEGHERMKSNYVRPRRQRQKMRRPPHVRDHILKEERRMYEGNEDV